MSGADEVRSGDRDPQESDAFKRDESDGEWPAASRSASRRTWTEPRPRLPRGIGCMLAALSVGFLCLLCLLSASIFGATGRGASGHLVEAHVSGPADGATKVVVIPLKGLIVEGGTLGGPFEQVDLVRFAARALEKAGADEAVRAVVLEIDTPGGTVNASDRIWKAIVDFKKETGKPVIASMGGVCASGGYYIAVAADRIVAQPTTLTGSIGVVAPGLNFSRLLEDHGVQDVTVASGPFKDLLSWSKPVDAAHVKVMQDLIDTFHAGFVEKIVAGRPQLKETVGGIADGRIFSAQQALALDLVDEIGYPEDAVAVAEKRAGISHACVVQYERQPGLLAMLSARAAPPAAQMPATPAEAVAEYVRLFRGPRFLYIWLP